MWVIERFIQRTRIIGALTSCLAFRRSRVEPVDARCRRTAYAPIPLATETPGPALEEAGLAGRLRICQTAREFGSSIERRRFFCVLERRPAMLKPAVCGWPNRLLRRARTPVMYAADLRDRDQATLVIRPPDACD